MTKRENINDRKYKDNSVMPININEEIEDNKVNAIKEQKLKFRSLVSDILDIRSQYHTHKGQTMSKKRNSVLTTIHEEDINDYVKTSAEDNVQNFNICIESK